MRSDEQGYKTIGLMIFTVIIIFSVVGIVIIGFKMVKKNEEAKLVAAADTEYMKKQKQDVESQEGSQEEKSTEESLNIEEFFDFATDSDKNTNVAANADPDSDTEVSEADARVYLIQGNEKSSNRYEKADHLSYTTVTKYTLQDLSILDSYGLKIQGMKSLPVMEECLTIRSYRSILNGSSGMFHRLRRMILILPV